MKMIFPWRKLQSCGGLDMEQTTYGPLNVPNLPSSLPVPRSFASGGLYSESNAAYFSWPTSTQLNDAAEVRASYFRGLQKNFQPGDVDHLPVEQQANSLLDLMSIRAFHSKALHCCTLGTAIGFRIRNGVLTDIPAILVFVARKVHKKWLRCGQCLPSVLVGPRGVWCDIDVLEFSYCGAHATTPKEQLYAEFADGLRGSDPYARSGSQVASLEAHGTLGAVVKRRTDSQVGFLTNRHNAVDLDYPTQKMFHPLPPNLGPGVYLGAVESATSLIMDDLWYGIFAGTSPESFVRADGAFIPFADDFDISNISVSVNGMGEIGNVKHIDLESPIKSLIGRQVMKLGWRSGLTTGTIIAYAFAHNDEKGICFFTDFLVLGEDRQTFDLDGDSGSLIVLTGQGDEKSYPVGIIWGGMTNRGMMRLGRGHAPKSWTSGVNLGRLLDLLELDLITNNDAFQEMVQEQRRGLAGALDSALEGPSQSPRTPPREKPNDNFEPLDLNVQQIAVDEDSCLEAPFLCRELSIDASVEEHQFIPSCPMHRNEENLEPRSLSALKNASDDEYVSLHLGD